MDKILEVKNLRDQTVDELKTAIGSNKTITISGFYPGYDGVYEYPITLGE